MAARKPGGRLVIRPLLLRPKLFRLWQEARASRAMCPKRVDAKFSSCSSKCATTPAGSLAMSALITDRVSRLCSPSPATAAAFISVWSRHRVPSLSPWRALGLAIFS